jgi:hypothetical protein
MAKKRETTHITIMPNGAELKLEESITRSCFRNVVNCIRRSDRGWGTGEVKTIAYLGADSGFRPAFLDVQFGCSGALTAHTRKRVALLAGCSPSDVVLLDDKHTIRILRISTSAYTPFSMQHRARQAPVHVTDLRPGLSQFCVTLAQMETAHYERTGTFLLFRTVSYTVRSREETLYIVSVTFTGCVVENPSQDCSSLVGMFQKTYPYCDGVTYHFDGIVFKVNGLSIPYAVPKNRPE